MRPFCHLVLRAIRVVPPPWLNDPSALSVSLKKCRLQAKLSQRQLAAKLGVHMETLGSWERGQAKPERRFWAGLQALLAGGL
jgi:DNA-binding transcriptional regulator YiaG